jgi:hypothetical protein
VFCCQLPCSDRNYYCFGSTQLTATRSDFAHLQILASGKPNGTLLHGLYHSYPLPQSHFRWRRWACLGCFESPIWCAFFTTTRKEVPQRNTNCIAPQRNSKVPHKTSPQTSGQRTAGPPHPTKQQAHIATLTSPSARYVSMHG